MKAGIFRRLLNLWPPFVGAGIRVEHISDDYREVIVRMRLRFYNRNAFGVHFGGSLFSMTDAFYVLMALRTLGSNYHVWDKAAQIEFVRPGRGTVTAHFHLSAETLDEIRQAAAGGGKVLRDLPVDITDAQGNLVARVVKTIYVRLKPELRPRALADGAPGASPQ